jgi:SAM-dependent methyltransferase
MNLLHAGCGRSALPDIFNGRYDEVRLDIDSEARPAIVASITDMGDIGSFDVVYSSHCVEHLYPQEVREALAEFYRVTKPGGSAIVIVPDLEGVQATEEVLYTVDGYGDLTGLDLIYGSRFDARANPYMAHHSGFVSSTLETAMRDAGFEVVTMKRLPQHNLMAVGQRTA